MKRSFNMLPQEINPHRVITTFEPWSSEVVRIHTSAETITRVGCPPHVLMTSRHEEGQLYATIDTILHADFIDTKLYLDWETPKRKGAFPE
jgi:hypothetical protein